MHRDARDMGGALQAVAAQFGITDAKVIPGKARRASLLFTRPGEEEPERFEFFASSDQHGRQNAIASLRRRLTPIDVTPPPAIDEPQPPTPPQIAREAPPIPLSEQKPFVAAQPEPSPKEPEPPAIAEPEAAPTRCTLGGATAIRLVSDLLVPAGDWLVIPPGDSAVTHLTEAQFQALKAAMAPAAPPIAPRQFIPPQRVAKVVRVDPRLAETVAVVEPAPVILPIADEDDAPPEPKQKQKRASRMWVTGEDDPVRGLGANVARVLAAMLHAETALTKDGLTAAELRDILTTEIHAQAIPQGVFLAKRAGLVGSRKRFGEEINEHHLTMRGRLRARLIGLAGFDRTDIRLPWRRPEERAA